jgi:hypothetical protein
MNPSSLSITSPGEPVRRLVVSTKAAALSCLLIFSFVPVPIFINVSQILLFLICMGVLSCPSAYFRGAVTLPLFIALCIGCSQFIGNTYFAAENKNYLTPLLFIASLLIAPSISSLAKEWPSDALKALLSRSLNFILAFLVLECISRLILSPHMISAAGLEDSQTFYLYKTSLFYVDSNFVGIALVCLIAVIINHADPYRNKRLALAYLLLLATFSRASIAAGICQFAIFKFWRWRRWLLFGLVITQVVVLGALFNDFITNGNGTTRELDPSFSTKFYILSLMAQSYAHAGAIQKLFGIGAGNADNLFGIFAHNIIATFSIEIGIVGFALVAIYVWIFARKCPEATYLLIFPIVINGFSLVSTSMPYFFASLGLLGAMHNLSRDGNGIGQRSRVWEVGRIRKDHHGQN